LAWFAPDCIKELSELLHLAQRPMASKRNYKNMLYSLHAPGVECISKGKAHKK
jgi:IS5 family transposase